MEYAKNSLGRSTGRKINMAAVAREIKAQREKREKAEAQEMYKDFAISGAAPRVGIEGWPKMFPSRKQAREAIDRCLEVRAMVH